jgi:membrane protein DedA with SNARE-associated domain
MSDVAGTPGDAPAVDSHQHHRHHSRRARLALLSAAAVLYVTGTIGTNIGPALIDEHPVWVLVLSSRNRNLFGSVPFIDPLPFAVIGFVRVVLVGVVLYYVGRWFGHTAVDWTERQLGELPTIYRWFERGLDRAGWAFVLLMPGSNLVCLMAGHRLMPQRRFLPLLAAGTVLKLGVLWVGGNIFEDQIKWFLDVIDDYQWWLVGGLFAISFLQSARKMRSNPPVDLIEAEGDEMEDDDPAASPAEDDGAHHAVAGNDDAR